MTRLTSSAGSNESGIDPGSSIESDDIQLVEDVLKGRVDSFRILVERYQNHVFRLALKLSNGDRERAADLAQETFLRAYRGLAGFAFDAKFSTWLHRVTLNVAISQKRRERAQKRGTALSLDVPVDEQSEEPRQVAARTRTPQQEVVASEGMRRVYEAVNSLDEDLKRLVILVNMEDYSYEDAAMMLNIPIGTVRSRLHRARELLMQKLRGTNRGR
ncbi:MAG: sigma-70 family RNA polymerase sigma factor [Planctomycetes bacterium]|nr:sigma-70 family RNA polymerase sigma factor [Planctomycetota bacterium]